MFYQTTENQTIFDICIIIYGNLDFVIKLATENNLNFTDKIPTGTQIYYDSIYKPISTRITTGDGLY